MLWKKVFLEISQNSQESSCARASFLIKLQASGKISKNTFFTEHFWETASVNLKSVTSLGAQMEMSKFWKNEYFLIIILRRFSTLYRIFCLRFCKIFKKILTPNWNSWIKFFCGFLKRNKDENDNYKSNRIANLWTAVCCCLNKS